MPSSLAGLWACITDARDALGVPGDWPTRPRSWVEITNRLAVGAGRMPPLYRELVVDPLWMHATTGGAHAGDSAAMLLPVAGAVLQRCENFQVLPTWALQELVSDLYDGFLSTEDRLPLGLPGRDIPAPLVHWDRSSTGARAITSDMLAPLGVLAGIVSFPIGHARLGLLTWAALSHEACGHDVLTADLGLLAELQQSVERGLWASGHGHAAQIWSSRIAEVTADIVGVLNLGPTAALSTIAHFRALEWLMSGTPRLTQQSGPQHPSSLLRGWMAAAAVERLRFSGARAWASLLRAELWHDSLGLTGLDADIAAATRVAEIIACSPCATLGGHALADIQNWYDHDEDRAQVIGQRLLAGEWSSDGLDDQTYAAHVVAGALVSAVTWGQPRSLQAAMQRVLFEMHQRNPSWGPLALVHPGDRQR